MTTSVLKMQRELVAVTEERDRLAAELAKLRAAPASDGMRDAYEGAREDLLDWKRQALEAERKLEHVLNDTQGAVKFGEPVTSRVELVEAGGCAPEIIAAPAVALEVWFGSMPESNGKTNWTAILHRGDITQGITIGRSEYKDRVRYEADKMRWMIGELEEKPRFMDYDAELHSGYKTSAVPAPSVPEEWRDMVAEILNWWDDQHMTLAQGRAIREKARALLQSTEGRCSQTHNEVRRD